MNRRGFIKGVCGLVAGGIGALLTRDHVRGVAKKVETGKWMAIDGHVCPYCTSRRIEMNVKQLNIRKCLICDEVFEESLLHVTLNGVYLDGRRIEETPGIDHFVIKNRGRRTATVLDEWA